MITKFQIFENLNEGEPEVGDYVLCKEFNISIGEEIIWEDIGIIEADIGKNLKYGMNNIYVRFFQNFPNQSKSWTRWFSKKDILYWTKDIEDICTVRDSKKYNL